MEITTQSTAGRADLVPQFSLPLPANVVADGGCTLAELIELTVRAEHAQADARQHAASLRRVLTDRELSEGLARGAVISGERDAPDLPSAKRAVDAALEAFGDGLFLVVVNGAQRTDLQERLTLTENSTVTYLRLVALVGG